MKNQTQFNHECSGGGIPSERENKTMSVKCAAKKLLIFLLILIPQFFGAGLLIAQQTPPAPPTQPLPPHPHKKEKIESMRIAFLTEKLDLSPEEAQKFWPVYNELQKKREDLHKKRREETKNAKQNPDSLSDKQVEIIVDGEMSFRQKKLDLEKEYHVKLKSVLPIKKVAKLYHAEEMFRSHLLDQISGKGKEGAAGGKKKGMAPKHAPPEVEDK